MSETPVLPRELHDKFFEAISARLGSRDDTLEHWLSVARDVADAYSADPKVREAAYQQMANVARDGIAAFHEARRKLGLSEQP